MEIDASGAHFGHFKDKCAAKASKKRHGDCIRILFSKNRLISLGMIFRSIAK